MINRNASSFLFPQTLGPFIMDDHVVKHEGKEYSLIPKHNIEDNDNAHKLVFQKDTFLQGFKRVIGIMPPKIQEIRDELGLPDWIKLDTLSHTHAGHFKKTAVEMTAHIGGMHNPEQKSKFRKRLM